MLEARSLTHRFAAGQPILDRLSLAVSPGEIVGLTGPSGCGKSTLCRLLAGHIAPQAGSIIVDGAPGPADGFHPVQLLLQSPELGMNPRWRIGRILAEGWTPDPAAAEVFGIGTSWLDRYPHELSGGELQRVAILRALAPGLRYIVADEITAMLDAISQADIWRKLMEVAKARGIGILAVSHDTSLLAHVASRVLQMSGGGLISRTIESFQQARGSCAAA